jgi:hypothetical protein
MARRNVGIAVAGEAVQADIEASLEPALVPAAADGASSVAADTTAAVTAATADLHQPDAITAGVEAATAPVLEHTAVAAAAVDAGAVDPDLSPNMSPKRKLFQTSSNANTKSVCNRGTPSTVTNAAPGRPTFTEPLGTLGITMQQTNVIPPDPTLAVGPREVLHVVNSLIKILPVGGNGGLSTSSRPGSTRTIPLPNFFSLVASPCDGGYINPSATYDKHIGRFLLTVVCGGDANQILLAASSSSSALGTWVLYSFAGEVTQGTNFQCANGSYPISLGTQVGYNQDGIYITYTQNCPTNQDTATGAILLALPKWAVYQGATYFWVPVWTAFDVYFATGGAQNSQFYPGAFLQLQPVMPQRPADVQAEVTYFMCDVSW